MSPMQLKVTVLELGWVKANMYSPDLLAKGTSVAKLMTLFNL